MLCSCFVEAADTNEAFLTVRETLLFAGACTLPIPSREAVESPYFQVTNPSNARPLVYNKDRDPPTRPSRRPTHE